MHVPYTLGRDFTGSVPVHDARVIVIGSGAAGLNAAIHLVENGIDPEAMVILTDCWGGGTSYNAGSDKQTYYKLSISGEGKDSPVSMARDLFKGGSMHGDIALCEAAGSIEEFFHLVRLGVDFPKNQYGMYPGYRTDNDATQRATSVGPYTSRRMVEVLSKEIIERGVPIANHRLVVSLLVDEDGQQPSLHGAVAIHACVSDGDDHDIGDKGIDLNNLPFEIFRSNAIVLATGGPANIYKDSVYPIHHFCGHGIGLEAGATARNLAFMQYGIASKAFRWNLSGSYQQVIPAYYTIQGESGEKRDILRPHFDSMAQEAYNIFLKGYQWPFNPRRCDPRNSARSSLVDLIVYHHGVERGEKVFMDFRMNPWDINDEPLSLNELPSNAWEYLEASGAIQDTPIERLENMNPFAINVYKDHGLNLHESPLEIQVAVQHCNGGFSADTNWESVNLPGLFPVGEVNGSHGQHRPGGAALNAGQVGGLRAANAISKRMIDGSIHENGNGNFLKLATTKIQWLATLVKRSKFSHSPGIKASKRARTSIIDIQDAWAEIRNRMTRHGSIVRSIDSLKKETLVAWKLVKRIDDGLPAKTIRDLISLFRCRDAAITHRVILSAMTEQMIHDPGTKPCYLRVEQSLESRGNILEVLKEQGYMINDSRTGNRALSSTLVGNECHHELEPVRGIPAVKDWFEAIMKDRAG
ncbi:FAD-binding protein [Candidatus Bathyarchaeota archaeon]|nr:FAD-binding protein [Candidatus Bathyarchaeota archaeon]